MSDVKVSVGRDPEDEIMEQAYQQEMAEINKKLEDEKLVTMSQTELEQLKADIVAEFNKKISEAEDRFKALEETYKKQEALARVDRRGQKSGVEGLEIHQIGPLGPIDHQGELVKEYAGELKGKKARFVNTSDPEVRALRRSQGYEPVRDKEGNEVRYMDGVLMAMPERMYDEKIKAPREARKKHHAASISNKFHESGAGYGVETYGDISYDS